MTTFSRTALALCAVFAAAVPALAKGKTTTKAAASADRTIPLDTTSSFLAWEGAKVTGKHNGKLKFSKGQIEVHNDQVVGGTFDVDMNSLTDEDITDAETNAKLVGHLKSGDFFDVAKFPTATFKLKSVTPKADSKTQYDVKGDLTLKGVTKPIAFPATISQAQGGFRATGQVLVDRTQFGLRYGSGKFFKGLGDKVINDTFTVDLNLIAIK